MAIRGRRGHIVCFHELRGIFPGAESLDLTSETICQRAAQAAQWARRGAGTQILSPARGVSRRQAGAPEKSASRGN